MRIAVRACSLAALLACVAQASAALRIEVEPAGLSPAELAATDALVEAALARLPALFRDGFDPPVRLHWRDDLD